MSEIKLNNGLGRKIKSYIERKGMKQSFVAFNANISNSHLSNVLCDRVLITPEVLRDINTVLETDFSLENSIITS
jgi:transcriptional regulator with XRE-family HTH domain